MLVRPVLLDNCVTNPGRYLPQSGVMPDGPSSTNDFRLALAVVTDLSKRSIATRSHPCPTSTCPMGALRGHGDLRARQTVQDAR